MKHLTASLIFALLASISHACTHLSFGTPSQADFVDCRISYAIGYDYSLKSAVWVAYELKAQGGEGVERTNDFREDPEIPKQYRTTPKDYEEPIYSQGHLANSESIDTSKKAMSETFLMSNIVPQNPTHNRGIWKGLENRERKWANKRGKVFVFSGVLYGGETKYIGNKVPVPSHFWKVVYDVDKQEAISFLIPHEPLLTKDLGQYLTSIDRIEEEAKINLLNKFGPKLQADIEAGPNSTWPWK